MFKLPFHVKKDDFFFNKKEERLFRIVVRAAIGLAALSVVILIIVGIVSAVPKSVPEEKLKETAVTLDESGGLKKALSPNQFVIPDSSGLGLEPGHILFRIRLGKWEQSMIDQFWVPPSKIGLENLRKMNDKNIEKLFEDVQ